MLIFVLVDVPTVCGAVVAGTFFAAVAALVADFAAALGAAFGVALGLSAVLDAALVAVLAVTLVAGFAAALGAAFDVALDLVAVLGVVLAVMLVVALTVAFPAALGVALAVATDLGLAFAAGVAEAVALVAVARFEPAAGFTSLTSVCATRLMVLVRLALLVVFFAEVTLVLAGRLATAFLVAAFGAVAACFTTGLTDALVDPVLVLTGLAGVFFTAALPDVVAVDFRGAAVALVATLRAVLPWVLDGPEALTLVATIGALSSKCIEQK